MVKGISIKFSSYETTIPRLLEVTKFSDAIQKHDKIVFKPNLNGEKTTPVAFVEEVLKFTMQHKRPETEVFIAEGVDGKDSYEVFEEKGYKRLAEKYGIGLVDLNNTETEESYDAEFARFEKIMYPTILKESLIISLPLISVDESLNFYGALDNMRGAFPAKHYKGLFSKRKSKLDAVPLKYQVHDILKCKMPEMTIADGHEKGVILAGQPFEIDKQAATAFGMDWKNVGYLKLVEESFNKRESN